MFSDLLFKFWEYCRERDNTCFQNNLGETSHVLKRILKYENTIGEKASVGSHSSKSSMIIPFCKVILIILKFLLMPEKFESLVSYSKYYMKWFTNFGWVFLFFTHTHTRLLSELHGIRTRENGHKREHGKFWYKKLFLFAFVFPASMKLVKHWNRHPGSWMKSPFSEIFRTQLQPWATWPDQTHSKEGIGLDDFWRSLPLEQRNF